MATSRFSATRVDTNVDRVTTFLAAHPGQFYCNACLSIEVPVADDIEFNRLTGPLHGVKPYRSGRVVCVSCGEVRECIAYGLQRDQLSRAQARQLGATARKRGRPIYENPCRGKLFEAWRKGWQEPSAAADRPPLQPGSFAAELYDYLVRHDQDEGLTRREITDGFEERDSATVKSGLDRLCKKGLVRRLLPTVAGWHRPTQRYRAVPMPPGVGE